MVARYSPKTAPGGKLAASLVVGLGAAVLVLTNPLAASRANAAELYAAEGVEFRWDNTLRYSAAARISAPSASILADLNGDDGDRDFAPGLVSNRVDLISQLDLARDDFGLHLSAAAWVDSVYHSATDNKSSATSNVIGVPSSRFAPAVRNLHGQFAELDDAFLYGTVGIADIPVSVRIGRQTVLWGESLFFDPNSIASAQAPTDYTRLATGENSYSNNVYLPITQLSATAQLLPNVAITLYNQFEGRPSRQMGDGSYLSYVDFIGAGAGRFFLSPGRYLIRDDDGKVSAAGQYGAALHISVSDTDFGLYALRFNARDPQIVETFEAGNSGPVGSYKLVFPKDINLFGASASTALADGTVAGEISLRQNMPLRLYEADETASIAMAGGRTYISGDLVHAQASVQLPIQRSSIWDSADLSGEIAADIVANAYTEAAPLDRFAMKMRLLVQPHYFQVLPNLDLTIPVGLGYNLTGEGYSYYAQNAGAGDFEIGISALYRSTWKASLVLTGFIGSPARQPLADRNFIAFTLERTF